MRPAVTVLLVFVTLGAAAGAASSQVPSPAQPAAADYNFGADTGLLVFHVHRERVGEFEQVMSRIGEGLSASSSQLRRDQASGWRLFRARDASDSAIYVLVVDPVVRGADYDPVKMLTELVPGEAPALYERLRAAVMRVERLDLDRLR